MASNKNPPKLEQGVLYENWETKIKLWQLVTDLPKTKQGPIVVLVLSGKAEQCALELPITEISAEDGVDRILTKLSKVFKKDTVDAAYEAFEEFIHLKRPADGNISNFITEFEAKYNKAKVHGCELSSPIRAYFLLNQANLSDANKQLARATVNKLEFDEMKTKQLKVFGSSETPDIESVKVKVESLNFVDGDEEDIYFGAYGGRSWRGDANQRYPRMNTGNGGGRNSYRGYNNYYRGGNAAQRSRGKPNSNTSYDSRGKPNYNTSYNSRSGRYRCSYCQSIYHAIEQCPDKEYEYQEEESQHDIVLYESQLVTDHDFSIFVAESSTSAILDCGASATVAGRIWFEGYYDGLCEESQKHVEYSTSNSSFRFGSGHWSAVL